MSVTNSNHFYQHTVYTSGITGKTFRVSSEQLIVSQTGGAPSQVIYPNQLLFPLVVNNYTGATGTWVLPTATQLASTFGGSQSGNQVSVGDVFIVPVYSLGTNGLTGAFYAASGSTGFKNIPVYTPFQNETDLVIQFTGNNPYTYTLQ